MSDAFRPPRRVNVASGEIDCQVADMTVLVAADVPLRRLQQELAAHRQWLAVDGDDSRTVGELATEDSTGALRLGFGGWRDILLGCQFKNGRGELISAGGQTMKNVAGYDLTKFMVGQRQTFGKVLTLAARTYRLPDGGVIARFAMPLDHAVKQMTALLTTPLRPQWGLINTEGLVCGYLGNQATLDYVRNALGADGNATGIEAGTLETDSSLRRSLLEGAWNGGNIRFRASIPPARLASFIAALSPATWVVDPVFGVVWGTCSQKSTSAGPGDADRFPIDAAGAKILHAAESSNGTVVMWNGDKVVHSRRPAGVDDLLSRLKAAFDPEGKLPPLPATPS